MISAASTHHSWLITDPNPGAKSGLTSPRSQWTQILRVLWQAAATPAPQPKEKTTELWETLETQNEKKRDDTSSWTKAPGSTLDSLEYELCFSQGGFGFSRGLKRSLDIVHSETRLLLTFTQSHCPEGGHVMSSCTCFQRTSHNYRNISCVSYTQNERKAFLKWKQKQTYKPITGLFNKTAFGDTGSESQQLRSWTFSD